MTTTTTTTTDRRQALVEGLRELASFLADHPDLPVNSPQISYYVLGGDDSEALARLADIAALTKAELTDVGGRPVTDDTTHFYVRRRFGPVTYEAAYVCRSAMADHHALMSYSGTVRGEQVTR